MEELDLKELFNIFWNKKAQIVLIVLIFMVIGIIYTLAFTTPMYSSYTTLVLASSGSTGTTGVTANTITTTDVTLNSKLVSTYSELVKSKKILRQVISNLGVDVSEASLKNNVTVSSVKDTELIEITVKNGDPTYAAQIANEIAKVFTQEVKQIYNINNVQVVDEAEIETTPSNINHPKDIILFAFVGVVIAVVYVLIENMLDNTVKTAEDVEKMFKVPVLASIPVYETEIRKGNTKGKGGKK